MSEKLGSGQSFNPHERGVSEDELDLIRFDGEAGQPRDIGEEAAGAAGVAPADAGCADLAPPTLDGPSGPGAAGVDPGQIYRFEDDGGPAPNGL